MTTTSGPFDMTHYPQEHRDAWAGGYNFAKWESLEDLERALGEERVARPWTPKDEWERLLAKVTALMGGNET